MERARRAPMRGEWAVAALLGGFLASAAPAQRLLFQPLPADTRVIASTPRLAFAELPRDDRIAPNDFALDDIFEEAPSSAQQAALDARLAALLPRQDYTPRPALWRISDRDTTIWLFGTIHVLPPGFRWRSPAIEAAAAGAHTLILESVDDPTAKPLYTAGDGTLPPLMQRVSPSHRAKLAQLIATLPPEAAATLDTLPTWVAAVAVSVAREIRAGEAPGPGADDWFEERFRAAGKPVVAIEDGAKVAAAANAIAEAEARAMLDAAIDAPPFDRERARAPLHAWAKGEVGPDSPIAVSLGSRALSDALLDTRNMAWAAELKTRLARTPGTLLFAAGAGHFMGPGAVQERLAALGIQVERVQ